MQGFVSIPDLRTALDVSESTIRRDLDALEETGEAQRTHGGVFLYGTERPAWDYLSIGVPVSGNRSDRLRLRPAG